MTNLDSSYYPELSLFTREERDGYYERTVRQNGPFRQIIVGRREREGEKNETFRSMRRNANSPDRADEEESMRRS